jgi:hypothetical protein
MEPVSPLSAAAAILGLAGKAWDLGRYIHNVYQGAKTVDTRIKNLSSEVHGLASTCDLVHAGLACVLTETASENHSEPYDPDGSLEKGIRGQVAQCEYTIEELRKITKRLWPRKKKFVDRTVRELKLQDAKEQIDDIRARIKSHTDALHTVLLVLSIKVAHISPARALDQLPEDLADLRESILRIDARLEHAPAPGYTAGGETPDLVECARGTLRSGTTLLNESLAGSAVGVDSVVGDEQAAVTNKAVEEWMASAERTGNEHRNALPTPPNAKDICKRTLKARSRLLGKQHQSRLETIALLSRICELLGETADSEVYLSMIPDDQRSKVVAAIGDIRPWGVDESAPSAPKVARARANRSARSVATEKPTVVSKGRRSGARRS